MTEVIGRLNEKRVNRAPFRQPDIFVFERIGKIDRASSGQRVIGAGDEDQSVGAVRQLLQPCRGGLAGHDADVR